WMVAAFLGIRSVGEYSLVAIVWSTVSLVPQVVATQSYPRLAGAWGRTGDRTVLAGLLKESALVSLVLTGAVVLAIEIAAPSLVRTFLPAYAPGVPAMRIATPGFLFQGGVYCYSNLFNVLGQQHRLLVVQAMAATFTAAATAGLLACG